MKYGKKIIAAGMTVCTMASLALAGCGEQNANSNPGSSPVVSSGEEATKAPISSLNIAIGKDENTLAPFTYVSSTGLTVNRLIYDTLFTTDLDNNIIPWMVEDDYQVDDKSQVFTMKLREGQKFHNGKDVTAEDIKFSFEYPKDQQVASYRKISNKIEKIEVVDPLTIRFMLKEPDINFMRDGFCSMRILSKDTYDGIENGTTVKETIGSGMYKLVEYKTGQYYKLEAMPDYFRGKPRVEKINMPIMSDSTAIQQGLLSGELAASTTTIGVEVVDTIKASGDLSVYANPGYAPMMFNINNGRAPFDNVKFRQALASGIDVNNICKTLYGDYATVGTRGAVRSDLPYAVPGLEYKYDEKNANELLNSLGYTNKNSDGIRLDAEGKPLDFEILTYANNTIRTRAAEMMAADLKKIGIKINVKPMEMDTVDAYVWPDFEVSKGRDYDLSTWGWGSALSPSYLIDLCASDFTLGGDNVCGYRSEKFDSLLNEKLSKITTMEEMESLLKELQQVVAEEIPLITVSYADNIQACNTKQYSGWKAGKGANVINIFTFLGDNLVK